MEKYVNIFKALADEYRLRILSLLFKQECCVCEIQQALGISQTSASRHLQNLHQAGLIKLRRDRLWALYSVDLTGFPPDVNKIMRGLEEMLSQNPLTKADFTRLKSSCRRDNI
ncbi:ArsR/SmtB family transcription factor [Dehalococcoides mccartyi]|uniref:Transcriptional regulator, ArsR family n=1 Tax=Dehalococcoides mccartyi (strain VS) TaxID=311424 RepID=D2BI50_DEHMV|nr:metalloregulator ArsR/SmtB family transcription factor [Dehalococcoides mccartyi]ACZ62000.1 transcriptional regulator, ArsR family [Dehalococcoides mccartyi VS]